MLRNILKCFCDCHYALLNIVLFSQLQILKLFNLQAETNTTTLNQDPQMQPQLQQNPQSIQSKIFILHLRSQNHYLTVLWVTDIILHEQTFPTRAC